MAKLGLLAVAVGTVTFSGTAAAQAGAGVSATAPPSCQVAAERAAHADRRREQHLFR